MFDNKVFVDADADDRAGGSFKRYSGTGQSVMMVLQRFHDTVKLPIFRLLTIKKYADIIIPRGGENEVAIGILISLIEKI
jgi:uridine kinase